MADIIALIVVLVVVGACVAVLIRFRLRWWTVLLSIALLLILFVSFFRTGSS